MMVRVTTARSNWVTGIAIPSLPTGDVDEEGVAIYQLPVFIGNGADEFPADEDQGTQASGRIYTEYNFNEIHLDYLDAQSAVTITKAGTFTGDQYPFPEETP
jgi:hypothetical protein